MRRTADFPVGHGSALQPTPLPDDRQLDVTNRHQALYLAAHALYTAGRWTCDRACDAAGLWTALRDALGLPPGTATSLGMGTRLATPAEAKQIFSGMEREVIRDLIGSYSREIRELRDRRDGLLEANNREVERRREVVGAARALRTAQRAYMADRGNEELGKAVGTTAAELDRVLGDA